VQRHIVGADKLVAPRLPDWPFIYVIQIYLLIERGRATPIVIVRLEHNLLVLGPSDEQVERRNPDSLRACGLKEQKQKDGAEEAERPTAYANPGGKEAES